MNNEETKDEASKFSTSRSSNIYNLKLKEQASNKRLEWALCEKIIKIQHVIYIINAAWQ